MNKNKKEIIIFGTIIIILIAIILGGLGYTIYKNISNNKKELNTPEEVFSNYIEYLNNNDYENAYNLLSNDSKSKISNEDFIEHYKIIYDELGVNKTEINNIKVDKLSNNDSKVIYSETLNTAYGMINFDNVIQLQKQNDKKYYIVWTDSVIYPELESTDKIDITKTYAKRGSLIDRNGILLAGSGYIASVGLVPGWMNEETKTEDIAKVAEILGTTSESINKKMSASYVKSDTFVELATLSKQSQTKIMELNKIQGLKIKDIASRVYPLSEKCAHITGYVQKASTEDMEKDKTLDKNSLVGKTGLESVYNDRLKGKDGYEICLLNEKGDKKKTLLKTEKEDGENIKLTIDSTYQELIYNTYVTDNSSTVVINPKTGEILAMVSTPSYDPNKFLIGMSTQEWNEISNNSNNPLLARFTKSYAPGSSFKPIIGAIALQTGTITGSTEYEASGTSWKKDSSWGSYNITTLKTYNGPANLLNALINSDNIFFAKTALKIGADKLEEQLKKLGFETDIGFDMNLAQSKISSEGKFTGEIELADSGYGQGKIQLNPVHFAAIYSSFVNDGNMIMPYIEYKSEATPKYYKENVFSKEVANEIKNDLIQTVENPEGTAYSGRIDGVSIGGKTGTAETKSAKGENGKEYGWYNAFIADENSSKQLMIISMVEGVENKGGSSYVVNKVKTIFEKLL